MQKAESGGQRRSGHTQRGSCSIPGRGIGRWDQGGGSGEKRDVGWFLEAELAGLADGLAVSSEKRETAQNHRVWLG